MKFQESKPRKQLLRGRDALSFSEDQRQPLDFNLDRDVTPEVWGQAEQHINYFLEDPDHWLGTARNLFLLAMVNPRVAEQLRFSVEFKTTVTKDFERLQPVITSYDNKTLKFLTDSLEVFPELRRTRQHSDMRAEDLMANARLHFKELEVPDWDGLLYTLRLYPEKRQEILALAQQIKPRVKEAYLNANHDAEREGSVEGAAKYLASGLLLYPEEAEYIRKKARGLWDNLLKTIRAADNSFFEEAIFAAAVLSAEEAVVTDNGSLRITARTAQLAKRPGLPERPVT